MYICIYTHSNFLLPPTWIVWVATSHKDPYASRQICPFDNSQRSDQVHLINPYKSHIRHCQTIKYFESHIIPTYTRSLAQAVFLWSLKWGAKPEVQLRQESLYNSILKFKNGPFTVHHCSSQFSMKNVMINFIECFRNPMKSSLRSVVNPIRCDPRGADPGGQGHHGVGRNGWRCRGARWKYGMVFTKNIPYKWI